MEAMTALPVAADKATSLKDDFFTGFKHILAPALIGAALGGAWHCLLYTSPSPRDGLLSRMPSSA